MKLKLGKLNLFIIILATLIFSSSLGWFMREGFDENGDGEHDGNVANITPLEVDNGSEEDMNEETQNEDIKMPDFIPGLLSPKRIENINMLPTELGIPKSEIPTGDDDLYILKSQIVPPVCPKCPNVTTCPREKPCRPCPPCARCPEPSFDCKKVPNYSSVNNSALPRAVLNDFSAFGM